MVTSCECVDSSPEAALLELSHLRKEKQIDVKHAIACGLSESVDVPVYWVITLMTHAKLTGTSTSPMPLPMWPHTK